MLFVRCNHAPPAAAPLISAALNRLRNRLTECRDYPATEDFVKQFRAQNHFCDAASSTEDMCESGRGARNYYQWKRHRN